MIRQIRERLFTLRHPYTTRLDRQRATGLLTVAYLIFGSWLLWMSLTLPALIAAEFSNSTQNAEALSALMIPIVALIMYNLIQRGYLVVASWVIVMLITLAVFGVVVTGLYRPNVMYILFPLILAVSLLRRNGIAIVVMLLIGILVVSGFVQSEMQEAVTIIPAERAIADAFLGINALIITLAFFVFLNLPTRNAAEALQDDFSQIQRIADFIPQLDKAPDEETAIATVINFVRNDLEYDFAQVFLLGGRGTVEKRVRMVLGMRSTATLEDTVTLPDASAIFEAVNTRQAVIVSREDSENRIRHFLATSNHGVALPIADDTLLIGVFDIQGQKPFTNEQIGALTSLTTNFASSIAIIRMTNALRSNLRQQEEATALLRARLQELRQSSAGVSSSLWDAYAAQKGQNVLGFNMGGAEGTFIPAADLPDSIRPVLESGALQIQTQGEVKIINIPIMLRDEVLGAMSFSVPKDKTISERQLDTAQLVANRLALALENKRLFEQAQALAARERKANEMTGLLLSATNVETVMNTAVEAFQEALGAINTRIHIQPDVLAEPERKREAL